MMHKARRDIEEVPYNLSRSSIKFQGHMAPKNWWLESNFIKITRSVAAMISLWFALLNLKSYFFTKLSFSWLFLHILVLSETNTGTLVSWIVEHIEIKEHLVKFAEKLTGEHLFCTISGATNKHVEFFITA